MRTIWCTLCWNTGAPSVSANLAGDLQGIALHNLHRLAMISRFLGFEETCGHQSLERVVSRAHPCIDPCSTRTEINAALHQFKMSPGSEMNTGPVGGVVAILAARRTIRGRSSKRDALQPPT